MTPDELSVYLDRLNAFEALVAEHVPEVLPEGKLDDGWAGAAGAEVHEEPYEPHPHHWDRTLLWCQLETTRRIANTQGVNYSDAFVDVHPELISGDIYRKACPHLRQIPRSKETNSA